MRVSSSPPESGDCVLMEQSSARGGLKNCYCSIISKINCNLVPSVPGIAATKVEFYCSTEKQNFSRTFSRTSQISWNPCVYRYFGKQKKYQKKFYWILSRTPVELSVEFWAQITASYNHKSRHKNPSFCLYPYRWQRSYCPFRRH